QFSFASDVRIQLAQRLANLAPAHCDKVYFWTVGSEAIECALRLARRWGQTRSSEKTHILTHRGDYHGWTLGAHQVSGQQATKPWLPNPDDGIHHLPFPTGNSDTDWTAHLEQQWRELAERGVASEQIAAVFIETLQGWGALRLPDEYVQGLRRWADEHDVLLIFDEVQTGFGRTGRWFAHEHYGVKADLICIGKGVTSSLPLAAVLGPREVLDTLAPGEITTTHAAHPLSCAAALANLDILEGEKLVDAARRKQTVVSSELNNLHERFPQFISATRGLGLLHAIHVTDPDTGQPSQRVAADWTWAAVKQGVMLFHTNQPSLKVCPPLTISDEAIVEGISALGDALQTLKPTTRS
ncbi:MAG: aspartate aminotransferase family protein, partial [Planctomycetaceae bacterium]